MSNQITTAYVKQFTEGITLLAQQTTSRLREAVRVEPIEGDRAFFDQVGISSMTKRTNRHAKTELTDTAHIRRMVTSDTYDKADMIDKRDESRILNNPMNAYTRSYAAAANRNTDQIIIDAFLASASTGVDGGTSVAHPGGTYQIAHGGVGLTLSKIVQAKKVLVAAENDKTMPWYFVYGAEELEDLLIDSTITSADYNTVRMLATGEVNTFMGFNWVHSELLALSGTTRSCIAFVRDSMLLGITDEIEGSVDRRADMNNGLQLQYTMDMGATRMDETGVVEVQVTE